MKEIFDNWIVPIIMTGVGIIGLMAGLAIVFAMVNLALDDLLSDKIKEWIKGYKK